MVSKALLQTILLLMQILPLTPCALLEPVPDAMLHSCSQQLSPSSCICQNGKIFFPKLTNLILKRCQVLVLSSAKLEQFYLWL